MNIDITPATEEHAKAVLVYYADLLGEKLPFIMDNPAPSLEQEIKFIRNHDGERSFLFLAISGGQVVGMSGYHIAGHPQQAHTCSLGISVAKPFRRCGIGSRLIAAGEEWCRSKSVRRLDFEVIDGNPAVTFYQNLGFEIEGRMRYAVKVGDGFRDLIIMAKILA